MTLNRASQMVKILTFAIVLSSCFQSVTVMAQTGNMFLITKCRGNGQGSTRAATEYFMGTGGNAPTVQALNDGSLMVTGHRVLFQDFSDSENIQCPYEFRQVDRVCRPLRRPACQAEVVIKHQATNGVELSASAGQTIMTCATGSTAENYADAESFLDAVHALKFPKPQLDIIGTRLDPIRRECLRIKE